MNAAFLSQWQLYRRGAARPPLVGLEPKTDSAFDADVAPGEIRVFADTNRPLVALVAEDRRLSGWRIVPVSPFCAPASDRERMVGERVFQLWNATVVSRRFASRSWRVDALPAADLAEVRGALAAANPGRLTAGDGVQAKYEREFLVGEGSLVPFAPPRAARTPRFAWLSTAARIAASFALCLAAWYFLMMGSGRRLVRDWSEGFREVVVAQDDGGGVIELYDAREPTDESALPPSDVEIDFMPPSATWLGRGGAPDVHDLARFADVKGPRVPTEIAKMSLKKMEGYKSPSVTPMDVVFLSSDLPREGEAPASAPSARAPGGGGLTYGASFGAALAAVPKVSCRLEEGARAGVLVDAVLTVEGEVADGAKVTVMFDPEVVEGYHRADDSSADGKVRVRYELMAFAGKRIDPAAVFVTLVWPSKDGTERTPLYPSASPRD